MNFCVVAAALFYALSTIGCGSSDRSNSASGNSALNPALPNGLSLPPIEGDNVMAISVNGSLCSSNSYLNKPCVSLKVCSPGKNNCKIISDILLDTGSYGLRIFKAALGDLNLDYTLSGSNTLTECVRFGSGVDWGPIARAAVILGNEPAVDIPIQIIDSLFSNSARYCPDADSGPSSAGFNGILGVGVFATDCGNLCASVSANKTYYSCTGTTCVSVSASLENQVQNPVARLPQDNNGLMVRLPQVPLGGVTSTEGYLVLGIGTRDNNTAEKVQVFSADPKTGYILTAFAGATLKSFFDTGSNGIVFSPNGVLELSNCGSGMTTFFCPKGLLQFNATNTGFLGSPVQGVPFQIGNALELQATQNRVFSELGQSLSNYFDWGLPFHLGRNVYIGIENTDSNLGTGPYFAY